MDEFSNGVSAELASGAEKQPKNGPTTEGKMKMENSTNRQYDKSPHPSVQYDTENEQLSDGKQEDGFEWIDHGQSMKNPKQDPCQTEEVPLADNSSHVNSTRNLKGTEQGYDTISKDMDTFTDKCTLQRFAGTDPKMAKNGNITNINTRQDQINSASEQSSRIAMDCPSVRGQPSFQPPARTVGDTERDHGAVYKDNGDSMNNATERYGGAKHNIMQESRRGYPVKRKDHSRTAIEESVDQWNTCKSQRQNPEMATDKRIPGNEVVKQSTLAFGSTSLSGQRSFQPPTRAVGDAEQGRGTVHKDNADAMNNATEHCGRTKYSITQESGRGYPKIHQDYNRTGTEESLDQLDTCKNQRQNPEMTTDKRLSVSEIVKQSRVAFGSASLSGQRSFQPSTRAVGDSERDHGTVSKDNANTVDNVSKAFGRTQYNSTQENRRIFLKLQQDHNRTGTEETVDPWESYKSHRQNPEMATDSETVKQTFQTATRTARNSERDHGAVSKDNANTMDNVSKACGRTDYNGAQENRRILPESQQDDSRTTTEDSVGPWEKKAMDGNISETKTGNNGGTNASKQTGGTALDSALVRGQQSFQPSTITVGDTERDRGAVYKDNADAMNNATERYVGNKYNIPQESGTGHPEIWKDPNRTAIEESVYQWDTCKSQRQNPEMATDSETVKQSFQSPTRTVRNCEWDYGAVSKDNADTVNNAPQPFGGTDCSGSQESRRIHPALDSALVKGQHSFQTSTRTVGDTEQQQHGTVHVDAMGNALEHLEHNIAQNVIKQCNEMLQGFKAITVYTEVHTFTTSGTKAVSKIAEKFETSNTVTSPQVEKPQESSTEEVSRPSHRKEATEVLDTDERQHGDHHQTSATSTGTPGKLYPDLSQELTDAKKDSLTAGDKNHVEQVQTTDEPNTEMGQEALGTDQSQNQSKSEDIKDSKNDQHISDQRPETDKESFSSSATNAVQLENENHEKCFLCGGEDVLQFPYERMTCQKCPEKVFCESCFATYHKHPKRSKHLEKPDEKLLDQKSTNQQQVTEHEENVSSAWKCEDCTFLNETLEELCEVCGNRRFKEQSTKFQSNKKIHSTKNAADPNEGKAEDIPTRGKKNEMHYNQNSKKDGKQPLVSATNTYVHNNSVEKCHLCGEIVKDSKILTCIKCPDKSFCQQCFGTYHVNPKRRKHLISANNKQSDWKKTSQQVGTDSSHESFKESVNPSAWKCENCTFVNETLKELCEICGDKRFKEQHYKFKSAKKMQNAESDEYFTMSIEEEEEEEEDDDDDDDTYKAMGKNKGQQNEATTKWKCKHCTFENSLNDSVCAVCSKTNEQLLKKTQKSDDDEEADGDVYCSLTSSVEKCRAPIDSQSHPVKAQQKQGKPNEKGNTFVCTKCDKKHKKSQGMCDQCKNREEAAMAHSNGNPPNYGFREDLYASSNPEDVICRRLMGEGLVKDPQKARVAAQLIVTMKCPQSDAIEITRKCNSYDEAVAEIKKKKPWLLRVFGF